MTRRKGSCYQHQEALLGDEIALLRRAYAALVMAHPELTADLKKEWTGHRKWMIKVGWFSEPRTDPPVPHPSGAEYPDGQPVFCYPDGSKYGLHARQEGGQWHALRYGAVCRFCDLEPAWRAQQGHAMSVCVWREHKMGWPKFYALALAHTLSCGLRWYAQHNTTTTKLLNIPQEV